MRKEGNMSVRGPQNFNLFTSPFGYGQQVPGFQLPQQYGRGAGAGQSNPFQRTTLNGELGVDQFGVFQAEVAPKANINRPPITAEGTGRRILFSA